MSPPDAEKKPNPSPEDAPDPDEDDLDDLDDVLDQFSATKIQATSTSPNGSGPRRPSTTHSAAPAPPPLLDDEPPISEEDFAKQLQTGMADMLKELESNPDMARQFEEMMAQFGPLPGDASADHSQSTQDAIKDVKAELDSPEKKPSATAAKSAEPLPQKSATSNSAEDKNFQDTIRKTMERINASSSAATAASASKTKDPSEDDLMSAFLAELGKGEGGEGSEDALSKMLLSMMEQLTNKEILYEPMKELDSKYPAWLEERAVGGPKEKEISNEDRKRYEEQRLLVKEIVGRFERQGYSDENPQDREFIVERMQKMQAAGAPPSELVGDMAGAEAIFNDMGPDAGSGGCPQQ